MNCVCANEGYHCIPFPSDQACQICRKQLVPDPQASFVGRYLLSHKYGVFCSVTCFEKRNDRKTRTSDEYVKSEDSTSKRIRVSL